MFKRISFLLIPFCVFSVLLLSGCASISDQVTQVKKPIYKPTNKTRSLLIFMRPSSFGWLIQSTLYDGLKYIGTLSANTQIAYQTSPGKHLFMVIGETADFMQADLLPNKTYYAEVMPRIGAWKARFSFRPQNGQIAQSDIEEWLADTTQVAPNSLGYDWAAENRDDIKAKHDKYLVEWNKKRPAEKQTLKASSGLYFQEFHWLEGFRR